MDRLRVLLLAPEANPDGICGSLIGFSEAQALGQLHDVTLLVRPAEAKAVLREQGSLQSVEVVQVERADKIFGWVIRHIFKNDYMTHAQSLTAFVRYPYSIAFEWQVWRQTRKRIKAGEFDVVLRLLPISAVIPSPMAYFLRNTKVPFVIGPVSGGLPWPSGFRQAKKHKQWISGLRGTYRFMPFARSTYLHATAIIAGASQTHSEFSQYREKLFFLLENGVDSSLCSPAQLNPRPANQKLQLIFVGSLTPVKGCDIGLRASAALLRAGSAHFTVVGDGPERQGLEELTRSLKIENAVTFCGMLSHSEAMQRLRMSEVMVFPSVRDNNPAVVFEAIAAGVVPVVADFGGPGDTVRSNIGFAVPLTNESDVVKEFEQILTSLADDSYTLAQMRRECVRYAMQHLTWDAKAEIFTSIMEWTLKRGPKPNLPSPKESHIAAANAPWGNTRESVSAE
jgi:glycosyltransferase involved in cell wall biosynthesis